MGQITILEYKEENLHKYHISLKLSLEVIDILNISEHYNLILMYTWLKIKPII